MMDAMTAGLVRAVTLTALHSLPNLHERGVVSWEALNIARVQVTHLLGLVEHPDDRQSLVELLVELG